MKSFKKYLINEAFSDKQLELLRKEYETLAKMDVTSASYKKLIVLLNKLDQDHLKSLAAANIKFVSKLAQNRVKKSTTESSELDERCWSGYKPTPGKKPYEKGSCMKEDDEDLQEDAEHDGKKVTLNKPFRTPDGPKKFAVYVKNDKGNVVKVTFGDPDMEIKRDDPDRRASYRARHNCSDPGPKWKANYWSCKMWADKPVSKITEQPDESAELNDTSSAAKLFAKFLRSTGAPDKVSTFVPKQSKSKTLYIGKSTNSKFDYAVDVLGGTVTATERGSVKNNSFVWNDSTGKLKINESSPPDTEIEKWINDNKSRFSKEYGSERGKQVLYATAWRMYNNK
jgi:hypothetical protein